MNTTKKMISTIFLKKKIFWFLVLIYTSNLSFGQNLDSTFRFIPTWNKGDSKKYTFEYTFADDRKVKAFLLKYTGEFKVVKKTRSGYLIEFTFSHIPEQKFIYGDLAGISTFMDGAVLKYQTDSNGKIIRFVNEEKVKTKLYKIGGSLTPPSQEPVTIKGSTIHLPANSMNNLLGTIAFNIYLKDTFLSIIKNGIFLIHANYNIKPYYDSKDLTVNIENNWDGHFLKALDNSFYLRHNSKGDSISIFNSCFIDKKEAVKELSLFYKNFCISEKFPQMDVNKLNEIFFSKEGKVDFTTKGNWVNAIYKEEKLKTLFNERFERFIIE